MMLFLSKLSEIKKKNEEEKEESKLLSPNVQESEVRSYISDGFPDE